MNNKLKMALAFVAGGVLINATTAVSNIQNPHELFTEALSTAMLKVSEHEKKREQEELNKLPNILECQNMNWLENCTEINKQAKKNPSAPIRIQNKEGLEFNFVPGTPSAIIRLQLEQSPAAAAAAVQYMDATWGEYNKSAELYQKALWVAGPLENIIGLEGAQKRAKEIKDIDTSALNLSVFVHSKCSACDIQLTTLASLKEKYPKLKVNVFQVDDNQPGFDSKVRERGLTGRIMSPNEVAMATESGVEVWPTIWIDNMKLRNRESLTGNKSMNQLEQKLVSMTYVTHAKAAK